MAIYNEILVGRYARMLQKLFGIKGIVPVKQLAGEIVPSFSLFNGVENRNLEGWTRFGLGVQVTLLAANIDNFQIRNPAKSNVIAVIEKLSFINQSGAIDVLLGSNGTTNIDLANLAIQANSRFDPRGNIAPSCIVSSDNSAAAPLTNIFFRGGIGAQDATLDLILHESQELTLLPGDAYKFQTTLVNSTTDVSIWWRERPLEESEAK